MAENPLNFTDLQNILSRSDLDKQRIILMWKFLGERYSGKDMRYGRDFEIIFIEYTTKSGKNGTFVLDKNTLATDFNFIFIPNKNGRAVK